MATATKLRPAPNQSCALRGTTGRKNSKADYQGGFRNGEVAVAWRICPGRANKKWEPFCTALLAVYYSIGRQRISQWLGELSPRHSVLDTQSCISNDELSMIWHRSAGFVRSHKRGPFEANMLALYQLDEPGFWFLIQELDFDARLHSGLIS